MDSSIISGLIGGLAAVIIGVFVTKAARMFFYDEDVHEQTSEFVSVLLLFFGFGIASAACFAEYFSVNGTFDSEEISFHTPWTGSKKEKWDSLVSANFNGSMYWYTLQFSSGKTIRLSAYLHGHGEVLELIRARGFDI